MVQQSPVCTYDFTLSLDHSNVDVLKSKLTAICKKWCFQLEEGESGYKHFQGRISLKVKTRITALKKALYNEIHVSITSNNNRNNEFYVLKEDTRIGGPWSDRDKYIPRQIRDITALYKWQQHIVDDAKVWNTRNINVVIDECGNQGKSILKTYIGVYGLGRSIPFSNDYRDIMRMVMGTPKTKLYIIDIPRGIKKDYLNQFFSGIETIKDGYAYDDRYSFREEYFDCPNIWIFMNYKPDTNYLSIDRWKFWTLKDKILEASI